MILKNSVIFKSLNLLDDMENINEKVALLLVLLVKMVHLLEFN